MTGIRFMNTWSGMRGRRFDGLVDPDGEDIKKTK